MKKLLFPLVFLIPVISFGQNYSIDWYKVSGGGGTSTGGDYSVSGTVGQPDGAGAISGGNYSLTGGFWSLTQVMQTHGAPLLIITRVGNQAIVSWDPSALGWILQTNNYLTTGIWGNYLGQVVNNSATNSPPAGTVFFRLKQQ
jgi:hypothetical protein